MIRWHGFSEAEEAEAQQRKILVREDSMSMMQMQIERVPETKFYNQVRLALTNGWGMVSDELNKAFPTIKPTSLEKFVLKWWDGVELEEANWNSENKTFAFDWWLNGRDVRSPPNEVKQTSWQLSCSLLSFEKCKHGADQAMRNREAVEAVFEPKYLISHDSPGLKETRKSQLWTSLAAKTLETWHE
ncbi:hypothetical protein KCU81_g1741, partial [Aureobasidium melanogenum]|uniref:Uncharacterized protein n=1 Tax=Aureobasidium melanogenum (strain CBS 110374) TaxID=1043003 RepID=A0A074VTV3_AURM1